MYKNIFTLYKLIFSKKSLIGALAKSNMLQISGKLSFAWLWPLVIPFIQISIYLFLFGVIFRRFDSQTISILIFGVLTFSLAQSSISSCSSSIPLSSSILSQLRVEPILFIFSSFLHAIWTLRFAAVIGLFLPVLLLGQISFKILYYPMILAFWLLLVWSLSLLASVLTVFARDLQVLIPYLLQIIMLLSPVLYSSENFPDIIRIISTFNPIAVIFSLFHWSVFDKQIPNSIEITLAFFIIFVLFLFSSSIYIKLSAGMIKIL